MEFPHVGTKVKYSHAWLKAHMSRAPRTPLPFAEMHGEVVTILWHKDKVRVRWEGIKSLKTLSPDDLEVINAS
jgi:hypothetical protein